jgi:hypothetical protein
MLPFVIILMIVVVGFLGAVLTVATVSQNSRPLPDYSQSRIDRETGGGGGGAISITMQEVETFISNNLKILYYTGGSASEGLSVYINGVNETEPVDTTLHLNAFISSSPGAFDFVGAFGTSLDARATFIDERKYLILDTTGKLSIVVQSKATGGFADENDFAETMQPRSFFQLVETSETADDTNIGDVQIIAKQNPIDPANNFVTDNPPQLIKRFNTADDDPQPSGVIQPVVSIQVFDGPNPECYYYKHEYQLAAADITKIFAVGAFKTYGLSATEQEKVLKNLQIGHVNGTSRHIYTDTDPAILMVKTVAAGITDDDFLDEASTLALFGLFNAHASGDNTVFAGYGATRFVYYGDYDIIVGISQNSTGCLIYTGPSQTDVTGPSPSIAFLQAIAKIDMQPNQTSFSDVTFEIDRSFTNTADPRSFGVNIPSTSIQGFFSGGNTMEVTGETPYLALPSLTLNTIGGASISNPDGGAAYTIERMTEPIHTFLIVKAKTGVAP